MEVSKWKHYSTWAIILLPVFTLLLEQVQVIDLGQCGQWVVPVISLIIGICKVIPQVAAAVEVGEDAE